MEVPSNLYFYKLSQNPFKAKFVKEKRGNTMATDNINARKEEKENINVHDRIELRLWSNKLGITKEILLDAIKEVGDSKNMVEQYLKDKDIHIIKHT
jgi:hypothetical protein